MLRWERVRERGPPLRRGKTVRITSHKKKPREKRRLKESPKEERGGGETVLLRREFGKPWLLYKKNAHAHGVCRKERSRRTIFRFPPPLHAKERGGGGK